VTVAERLGYAVAMTRASMAGGERRVFGYAGTAAAGWRTLPADSLGTRLRQAPRVFRAALAAARDAD
jgi:hypothetical protein